MYTWLWCETRQCVCYKDLLEDIQKGQYCINNMILKVWNRQGKPMLESIAYISYTVACCVKSFEKYIFLSYPIICRRTICDRKRWSACQKRPKNGCWDVHLSCKVCQQLHIFKEYREEGGTKSTFHNTFTMISIRFFFEYQENCFDLQCLSNSIQKTNRTRT